MLGRLDPVDQIPEGSLDAGAARRAGAALGRGLAALPRLLGPAEVAGAAPADVVAVVELLPHVGAGELILEVDGGPLDLAVGVASAAATAVEAGGAGRRDGVVGGDGRDGVDGCWHAGGGCGGWGAEDVA